MLKSSMVYGALFILVAGTFACGDSEDSQDERPEAEPLVEVVDGWTAELTARSAPLAAGAETFVIELHEANEGVQPETLEVEAWMPAHGHGTMKPTEIEAVDTGVYEAVVTFSMPGDWELRVDADERRFVFDVEVLP